MLEETGGERKRASGFVFPILADRQTQELDLSIAGIQQCKPSR